MNDSGSPASAAAPLAIVGLSCLFPKANDLGEFWSNLRRGVDAISEIPATHWDPEAYFDRDPKRPDMTYARRGGFLSPIPFDPLEFGIAPSNLEAIDTSQLLGLVAAKRALADAGYGEGGKSFDRSRAGCILGVTGTLEMVIPLGARLGHPKWRQALKDAGVSDDVADDVMSRIGESYVSWQENSFPGLLGNVVAGRITNRLDLGGTNCVVDAACASSLSAIHLAALELWNGRSDLVITGGVDTFNDIFMYMCFSKTPALSATGDARPFADNADGTILGEGVGMLVLKRLADAERDGDKIYAVLRGIGTSSDGAGNAVYAPKKEGQVRCLKDAYRVAGVSPSTIELVEAHGTGTRVGDAIEVQALQEVYRDTGRTGQWCALGSVKSQIGHTKAAAGSAGVMKAILALRHRVLPPTIKVEKPQDLLLAEDSPFYVNTLPRPWLATREHPRRAAVSAFGFGGSNFHCVLEESPIPAEDIDWDDDVLLVTLSSDSAVGLREQLASWRGPLTWRSARVKAAESRAAFRAEHDQRLIFVCDRERATLPDMVASAELLLEKYADRDHWSTPDGILFGRGARTGKLAVLFPGQGSQSVGMLRELACRFPVMQSVLSEADEAFAAFAEGEERQGKLSEYIYPPPAFTSAVRDRQDAQLRATQVAQPALGAVSLGALAILREFGVKPEITAGHSYGELTALCASRRFRPQALYRLSMLRGQLMAEAQDVDGGMLAVGASLQQVEEAIRESAVDLVVANRNGPNQVVLSGRLPDIDRAAELFARRNLRGKKLQVAAAFHSPLVAAASRRFRPVLDEVEFEAAEVPVYANTSADVYPADPSAARDLLANQLARPVEFVQQVENIYAAGARLFVEVGPGAVLTGLVGSILSGREHRAIAIDQSAGKRSGLSDLATVLAQLGVAGYPVNFGAWDPSPPLVPVADPQRLTVPLSGANYVKPRTPRPPRTTPSMPTSTRTMTSSVAAASAVASSATQPAVTPPPRPPQPMVSGAARVATPAPSPGPSPVLTPTAVSPTSGVIPESLAVLQRMHEETSRLHRQFLEGQESALRTLESLIRGGSMPAATAVAEVRERVPSTPAQPMPAQPMPAPAMPRPTSRPGIAAAPPPRLEPTPVAGRTQLVEDGYFLPLPSTPTAPAGSSSPTAPAASDLTPQILAVVAEKTGYPVEMLKPGMSLDHDLGIDSIKRVEILSAVQERLPQLPAVTPEQLQTLHRLQDVIDLLGSAAAPVEQDPGMAIPGLLQSAPNIDLTPQILAVVAEKTGYPVEMLKPGMSLDHDLGIDSIKRVEILSAVQERLPQLPAVTPEQLQTLHRLQDVIDLLGSAAAPVEQDPGMAIPGLLQSAPNIDLTPQILAVVAEKTGYPVEMLKPGMSLDHDLGIDSIKRVEILSAVQERLPQLPAVTPEQLQTLHRLQDVIDLLGAATASPPPSQPVPVSEPVSSPVFAEPSSESRSSDVLIRGLVMAVPCDESPRERLPLPKSGVFWITDDGSELALGIASQLTQAGYTPRLVRFDEPSIPAGHDVVAGLVLIAPSSGTTDQHLWRAIEWVQKAGPTLRQTAHAGHAVVLATLSRMNGSFGLEPTSGPLTDIVSGGLAGLIKTVGHEWPDVVCKALDLPAGFADGAAIVTELLHRGPQEIGFSAAGRVEVAIREDRLPSGRAETLPLHEHDLVLVTGGARGVTAAAALALAKAYRPRLVLLGRSPEPKPEPDWLRGLSDPARIKQALATQGAAASPRALQQQCQQILANREIEETLAALRTLGVPAEYRSVDVREIAHVCELLDRLRRDYGPIRGLIHGAGVLADQRIEDKTRDQFDRVFATKVTGLRNLLGSLPAEELRCLVLFSSFTARFGRKGQIDYAIANEVLNKFGQQWRQRNPACRVVAFNWGPWDGGMVQGGLKDLFAREGVGLIPIDAGAELVARELEQPATSVEVVVLGPGSRTLADSTKVAPATPASEVAPEPAAEARLAFERQLSVTRAPYLSSHVLGGKAVLPVAMIVEWLGHAALHRNPGLDFQGVDGLKIYKGVRLDAGQALTLRVAASKPRRAGNRFMAPVQLVSHDGERDVLHAAAEIVLATGYGEPTSSRLAELSSANGNLSEPYSRLFHGPAFQGIERVDHCSREGIVVASRTSLPPGDWMQDPLRSHWLADPLALDCGLQAVILWCQDQRGIPCLPTSLGRYRQYRRSFPRDGVRIVVRITDAREHQVRADLDFYDRAGQLVAELRETTHVLDASLTEAFRANHLPS